jgi:hypothetical protein
MKLAAVILATIGMGFGANHVDAGSDVNVCGQLNAYQPAIAKDGKPQDIILSLKTSAGFVDYRLVLNGTVPADLGQDPKLPEILQLTGRRVEGINTVADYTVARVASCALPSTSTAAVMVDEGAFGWIAVILMALCVLAGTVVVRDDARRLVL